MTYAVMDLMDEPEQPATYGVFNKVTYIESSPMTTSVEQVHYQRGFEIVLSRMARIKRNPDWCDFLSEETKTDVAKGLHNLGHIPLYVSSRPDHNQATVAYEDDDLRRAWINITPYTMKMDASACRGVMAHELGHIVMSASDKKLSAYTGDYKQNHVIEHNADKLALAFEPNVSIGRSLVNEFTGHNAYHESFHETLGKKPGPEGSFCVRSRMTELYEKGVLPHRAARLLGLFYEVRDEIFCISDFYKYKSLKGLSKDAYREEKKKIDLEIEARNDRYNMRVSPTHPSPLVRAVKGAEFSDRMKKFAHKNPL